jgi:hypothetical protein
MHVYEMLDGGVLHHVSSDGYLTPACKCNPCSGALPWLSIMRTRQWRALVYLLSSRFRSPLSGNHQCSCGENTGSLGSVMQEPACFEFFLFLFFFFFFPPMIFHSSGAETNRSGKKNQLQNIVVRVVFIYTTCEM